MFEAELFASGGEGVRGIARPIIGHDPFDGDAEASVAGEGGFQMGEGAACFLIGEDACMDAGERTSHFLAVTRDTPATAAALASVCP